MKHLLFYVAIFTFLLQVCRGGWIEQHYERLKTSLVKPLEEISQQIDGHVAELEAKKTVLMQHQKELSERLANLPEECQSKNLESHATVFSSWDLEGCLNLTGDWKDGVLVGMKAAIYGANITEAIYHSMQTAMDQCPHMNVFKILPCYYTQFMDLMKELNSIREEVQPVLEQFKPIVASMKEDFDKCLGIPYAIKERIDRSVTEC